MRKKKLNLLHFSHGETDFDEEVDDFMEDEEQEDEKIKILDNYENITPTKEVTNIVLFTLKGYIIHYM